MSDENESEVKDSEALERAVGSGGKARRDKIMDYVDSVSGPPDEGRKLPRGRTGVSRGQSPKGEEKTEE